MITVDGKRIQNVTLYGAGLIGAGWATHLLLKGVKHLTLFDINAQALEKGLSILGTNLSFIVSQGVLNEEQSNALLHSVKTTLDVREAVGDADLVIENGPEIVNVKQDIIANSESACRDDVIITSSTS